MWITAAPAFLTAYFTGTTYNGTAAQLAALTASYGSTQAIAAANAPGVTEDCLFLDVMVPTSIYNNRARGYGAPVLVWIYGGGYTAGSKAGSGNPAGLIMRSETNNETGVIYVALNYRLGAFGWLAGPTLQSNGTANAGLYDQRLALNWIKANIAKFGGDPNRITVFGESAGGGSIEHQITAYGGLVPAPFAQAIPQSPGFLPITSNRQMEDTFNTYLSLLNVSTIEQARQLPYQTLAVANLIQIARSTYGTFVYGPVVDGSFVPALPGKLLLQGSYDKSVRVMVGHNGNEGILFTSPFIMTEADFTTYLVGVFPDATNATISYIQNTLYPPVYNGSLGYTSIIGRAALIASEISFTCNTVYFDYASGNTTYSYFFTVPPATHGQDIAFTFYNNGGPSTTITNTTVAIALQDYITTYAEFGYPSSPDVAGAPLFAMYGPNSTVQDLGQTTISRVMDPASNARCAWFQKALYY